MFRVRVAYVVGITSSLAVTPIASAEVLTWSCKFEHRIDAEGKASEPMSLIFKVDTISKRALMEGNAGLVDVDLHIGDHAFSFTEKVGSGAAQTTTVTKDG